MLVIDMRDDARDQDDVDRAAAHDLVGDAEIAALRILRLGQCKFSHGRPRYDVAGTEYWSDRG